jgi:hypothetical protein
VRRQEIIILLFLLAAILSAGFIANAGSFASNALASAADLIVGIFIAFYLVDRISRRERAVKWQKVKDLSYRAVEATCDLMMFAFDTTPPTSVRLRPSDGKPKPQSQTRYESFLALGGQIILNIEELYRTDPIVVDPSLREPDLPKDVTVEVFRDGVLKVSNERRAAERHRAQLHEVSSQTLIMEVTPHFEKLSLYIFPRILELDENQELISSFLEVESAYRDWTSAVDTIEGDWGLPEEYAWRAVAVFCEKVGEMLKIIHLDQRKSDRPLEETVSETMSDANTSIPTSDEQ